MARSRVGVKEPQIRTRQVQEVDRREVECVAYELYEQRGRVGGYALDDWLKAEEIVRQRASARRNA